MPRSTLRLILLATAMSVPGAAYAQDATTYVEAFNAPVFDAVDQNGVDLVSGSPRITTPVMQTGSDEHKRVRGLQWTGKAWTIIGQPTIWRDGDKYIVHYRGQSEEFNDRSSNYSERKPISGAALSCVINMPGGLTSDCLFTDRDGDVVEFKGRYSPYTPYPANYGPSSFAWGNIGMAEATITSVDRANEGYGSAFAGNAAEQNYYQREVTLTLGQQTLKIVTPNHNADTDEHYLRPVNTTQSVTDSFGSTWTYTINDNRRLTRATSPDGAWVNFTYNNGKVATVTNAAGTWSYSYTEPGDYGTTTVTNPQGEQTYVKYHRSRGYVTESRDALNRWTYYTYDAGYHLTRITYPEGNYVDYTYDARGNITTKVTVPKPSVGGPVLTERAGYDAACADPVTCNKPRWIEDARGARTDFDYAPSGTGSIARWGGGGTASIRVGTGKPVTVTSPAVNGIRPQVRTAYASGMPVTVSTCRTQASCAGTGDEVVTTYDWGGTQANIRTLFGKAVTAGGQTLRTCYGYDSNGRRISETPPTAGLASCPTTVTQAPAVTATMPSAGTNAVAPTFPDGTVGTGGGGGGDPVDPTCGYGGVICQ